MHQSPVYENRLGFFNGTRVWLVRRLRSSKTPGINQALSNVYLKSEGLYELRDGWIKLHYSE